MKRLVTPEGWQFEKSLSQQFQFVPTGRGEETLKFLRHEDGVDVYMDLIANEEIYIGRTSREVAPDIGSDQVSLHNSHTRNRRQSIRGLSGLFKRQGKKEKTCEDCSHFIPEREHIDFEGGEYMTIHKSSCAIHGEFDTFHSGNLNKKVIDESGLYRTMLLEKARECKEFRNRHDSRADR